MGKEEKIIKRGIPNLSDIINQEDENKTVNDENSTNETVEEINEEYDFGNDEIENEGESFNKTDL